MLITCIEETNSCVASRKYIIGGVSVWCWRKEKDYWAQVLPEKHFVDLKWAIMKICGGEECYICVYICI